MKIKIESSTISGEAAHLAVAGSVRYAESLSVKINVAVVDVGGNLMAFLRMPGAFLHSITIAQDKAYTAAGFGFPTHAWPEIVGTNPSFLRDGLMNRDRLVMLGGGLPIVVDGQVCGGIGVSGATEEQDQACARAGLDAIGISE